MSSRLRRLFGLWTVVLAVTAGPLLTLPSFASAEKPEQPKPWVPPQGAFFNVPRSGPDGIYVLERQVVRAIKHARKGSLIRIVSFSFDRRPVAKQLVKAHKRGVNVQILLNDHQVTGAQRILRRGLGQNRAKETFSYDCDHGCRSNGEVLHTKFYLFSHTGGARDVVMTGSHNLTQNSNKNMWNDLWVKNGDKPLYQDFSELFGEMRRDKAARPSFWVRKVADRYELMATPYRHFRADNDPIMSILGRVHCKGATGRAGNAAHRTVIRVAMHVFNETRGVYIAKKLRRLWLSGCDVRIITGLIGSEVRSVLTSSSKRGPVPLHNDGYDTNGDREVDLLSHTKYMVISGNYAKDRSTNLVMTGSSNWTNHGLEGDEEIFLIRGRAVSRQYLRNHAFIWKGYSNPLTARRALVGKVVHAERHALEG